MINLQLTLILLFTHWVGDYLLQFNTMANRKREDMLWMALHILVYSSILLAVTLFLLPWQTALNFVFINGILHLVTDLITTNLAFKYKSSPRVYYPIIGFDQFIHTATLIIILHWIAK